MRQGDFLYDKPNISSIVEGMVAWGESFRSLERTNI